MGKLLIANSFPIVLLLTMNVVSSFSFSASPRISGLMQAVLWDVDGTLSNSYNLGFVATNEVLKANGYDEISGEVYHQGTRYSTPLRFSWHVTGDSSEVSEEGNRLGLQFDNLYIGKVTEETTRFYPGIRSVVKSISEMDYKQGALSNAAGEYVRAVLAANEVSELFEVQIGADEVPSPKPSPEGLLQCCQQMNVEPSLCIYIGDSPSDGEAAKAAGMKSIGVAWGSHSAQNIEQKFDTIVENVSELSSCLALLGIKEKLPRN